MPTPKWAEGLDWQWGAAPRPTRRCGPETSASVSTTKTTATHDDDERHQHHHQHEEAPPSSLGRVRALSYIQPRFSAEAVSLGGIGVIKGIIDESAPTLSKSRRASDAATSYKAWVAHGARY